MTSLSEKGTSRKPEDTPALGLAPADVEKL